MELPKRAKGDQYTRAGRYRELEADVRRRVDGHDIPAILRAFADAKQVHERPAVLLARTIKGKGGHVYAFRSALCLVRYDEPISWGPDKPVRVVVGIAGVGGWLKDPKDFKETLPGIKLIPESTEHAFVWSEVVNEKVELWPIQFLMPGGAYIH